MLAILAAVVVAVVEAAVLLTAGVLLGRAYEQRKALQAAGHGAGLPSARAIWMATTVMLVTLLPILAVVIFVAVARHS